MKGEHFFLPLRIVYHLYSYLLLTSLLNPHMLFSSVCLFFFFLQLRVWVYHLTCYGVSPASVL